MATNVLFYASVGLACAAVLGHVLGTIVAVVIVVGMVAAQQMLGPLPWFPVTSGWDPEPRWLASSVAVLMSATVYRYRLGHSVLESRLLRNQD